jgi:hypothetical protein
MSEAEPHFHGTEDPQNSKYLIEPASSRMSTTHGSHDDDDSHDTTLEIKIRGNIGYRYPGKKVAEQETKNNEGAAVTMNASFHDLGNARQGERDTEGEDRAVMLARLRQRYEQAQAKWLEEQQIALMRADDKAAGQSQQQAHGVLERLESLMKLRRLLEPDVRGQKQHSAEEVILGDGVPTDEDNKPSWSVASGLQQNGAPFLTR